MSHFDFIITGSGVSGMTFAHKAVRKGKTILVLEKGGEAGGCLCTAHHENFWLELGGHTIYSSYATYIAAMKDAGMEADFLPRIKAPFKMYVKDKIVSITSVMSFFELFMNGWKLFYMKKDGKTVREFYSAVLGKGNYEKMFRPMISAVISQDGSDFPADLMLKSRPKDKNMPRHFTIRNGMNSYIQKVAAMEGITLKTSCGVKSAEYTDGKYTVTCDNDEIYTSDNLVMACAPQEAAGIIAPFAKEAAEILNRIPSAGVESLGVIVNAGDISLPALSFIVAQDGSFTSVVARDVVPDDKYRGFAFHFKPGKLTYEQKIETVSKILGVPEKSFVKIQEDYHLSPTLAKGHEQLIETVDEKIRKVKGLYVTGNYFGGMAIEDCSQRSSAEAARI